MLFASTLQFTLVWRLKIQHVVAQNAGSVRTKQVFYWILHIYLVEKHFSTFFIKQTICSGLFLCKKSNIKKSTNYFFLIHLFGQRNFLSTLTFNKRRKILLEVCNKAVIECIFPPLLYTPISIHTYFFQKRGVCSAAEVVLHKTAV